MGRLLRKNKSINPCNLVLGKGYKCNIRTVRYYLGPRYTFKPKVKYIDNRTILLKFNENIETFHLFTSSFLAHYENDISMYKDIDIDDRLSDKQMDRLIEHFNKQIDGWKETKQTIESYCTIEKDNDNTVKIKVIADYDIDYLFNMDNTRNQENNSFIYYFDDIIEAKKNQSLFCDANSIIKMLTFRN